MGRTHGRYGTCPLRRSTNVLSRTHWFQRTLSSIKDQTNGTWLRQISSMQGKPFDSFIDYAAMPVAILDAQLRFVKVNPAMAHRLPVEAHLGKTLAEVLPNLSKRIQPFLFAPQSRRE
jgi:PAS domain-containing protein